MTHQRVDCRSNAAAIKQYYITTLLTLKPHLYTPQGLQTCALATLEAELRLYASSDPRAQTALGQPWPPPSIVCHHLAPTTGPVEYGKTPRLHTAWRGAVWLSHGIAFLQYCGLPTRDLPRSSLAWRCVPMPHAPARRDQAVGNTTRS